MTLWRRVAPWLPVPLPRLALVAAVASIAVAALPLGTSVALLVVNAVLLAVAMVDAARVSSALTVSRRCPDVVAVGQQAAIEWRIENRAGRALAVEVGDELAPSLGASTRRVSVVVPAHGSAVASTTIRPTRRGRFELTDVVVRTAGPLRLVALQRRRSLSHTLRVYPAFPSRREAELRIDRARVLEVGLRSAKGRGGGTDFDTLREYSPDDEFRRMDWSATARTGRAIVRTYRAERNQTMLMLLDVGRLMAGRVAGAPRLEHAMDAVMMLTTVATRLGDRAGLIAFDDEVRAVVPPSHSRGQLTRVTEAMYGLEPRLVESDHSSAFTEAVGRFRRRALLVVFTELAEHAVADTLLPALPLVVRDHLVVLASVRDPDVASWAAGDVGDDVRDAYRRAAAVAAIEERRRLTARLRGRGVIVVDEPPGRLAPALADAYLQAKATGRL